MLILMFWYLVIGAVFGLIILFFGLLFKIPAMEELTQEYTYSAIIPMIIFWPLILIDLFLHVVLNIEFSFMEKIAELLEKVSSLLHKSVEFIVKRDLSSFLRENISVEKGVILSIKKVSIDWSLKKVEAHVCVFPEKFCSEILEKLNSQHEDVLKFLKSKKSKISEIKFILEKE